MVECKKSFDIYCQILLKVITKVGLKFVQFSWTKLSEMKPRVNLFSKESFFYQGSKLRKYLKKNFKVSLAKFSKIIWHLLALSKI
jgi:hypothetical protein